MKKIFLLSVAAGFSAVAYGQRTAVTVARKTFNQSHKHMAAKTTAFGDTVVMPFINYATDTFLIYGADHSPFDSGFITGMNAYGDKAFAQRFDVNAADSQVKVLGVIAAFSGTVSVASSHTITFNVWSQAPKSSGMRPSLFNSGLPDSSLASKVVNVRNLGIGMTAAESDTAKLHWFATPTGVLGHNFFVGYEMAYAWGATAGDTIGLYCTTDGDRPVPAYNIVSASDTTINNYNVTKYADNSWNDNAVSNFGLFNKLYIVPVIVAYPGTTAMAITNNGFTFHGAYPNPATNATYISFGLASAADVTIQVLDMSGRAVSTISKKGFAAGEHTVAVETANLAAGEYVYIINTTVGAAIASKFTVIK